MSKPEDMWTHIERLADEAGFEMGRPQVNAASGYCCGKPVGCTNPDPRCLFLQHPWKRENVFGEKP